VKTNDKSFEKDLAKLKAAKESKETSSLSENNLKEFFSRPAYLTASAQLHLEAMTSTLGNVYTLSPTFRAEKSMTRHHLAEFYMLEAELIDMTNIEQILDFVEKFVKQVGLSTYTNFDRHDMNLISFANNSAKTDYDHVQFVSGLLNNKSFVRVSYREAVKILNDLLSSSKKHAKVIKKRIGFGEDLNKEQEKLLVEYFEQVPVFITHYPKKIKPFYMRQNEANAELVDNFDLLAPSVGEIVGGSLREYRVELLEARIRESNLDMELFRQYIETKRYGAMKMGGFGLGLERFVQFLANVENIKDTCAFPRSLYNCKM
jgi:asparaginyl-tRNA synthetase